MFRLGSDQLLVDATGQNKISASDKTPHITPICFSNPTKS